MTPTCPDGHASVSTDYCDVCGLAIPASSSAGPAPHATVVLPALDDDDDTSATVPPEPCPVCGARRLPNELVCEACGHDFRGRASNEKEWEVTVHADRDQFARVAAPGLAFPAEASELTVPLVGDRMRIGRGRDRDGVLPEIDLVGRVEDPGISRPHAVLERSSDGSYAVRDLGSTNGTTVGHELTVVGTDAAVPLADGDVIHIGAWTAITIHSRCLSVGRVRSHED